MHAVTTRFVMASVVVLVVGVACDAADPMSPEAKQTPVDCAAPEFAPTYLPWDDGQIAAPETRSEGRDAISEWNAQGRAKFKPRVSLVRRYHAWTDTKHYPKLPVRGTEGYVVWIGDPGVGELSLRWSEGDQPCDHYALYVLDQSLNERQAENELARISRSLR